MQVELLSDLNSVLKCIHAHDVILYVCMTVRSTQLKLVKPSKVTMSYRHAGVLIPCKNIIFIVH